MYQLLSVAKSVVKIMFNFCIAGVRTFYTKKFFQWVSEVKIVRGEVRAVWRVIRAFSFEFPQCTRCKASYIVLHEP